MAPPGAFARRVRAVADWCRRRDDELRVARGRAGATPQLDPEDDALLLRAWQLRVGRCAAAGRAAALRHVAIDEVQDFSPLEVRVLLDCLDERRSLTLAGDTQQHVLPEAGFTSWSDFFRHLGVAGAEVETLRVSYRSTHEIVELRARRARRPARGRRAAAATRSGPPVELFRFTDHGACVAFLADALRGSRAASRSPRWRC